MLNKIYLLINSIFDDEEINKELYMEICSKMYEINRTKFTEKRGELLESIKIKFNKKILDYILPKTTLDANLNYFENFWLYTYKKTKQIEACLIFLPNNYLENILLDLWEKEYLNDKYIILFTNFNNNLNNKKYLHVNFSSILNKYYKDIDCKFNQFIFIYRKENIDTILNNTIFTKNIDEYINLYTTIVNEENHIKKTYNFNYDIITYINDLFYKQQDNYIESYITSNNYKDLFSLYSFNEWYNICNELIIISLTKYFLKKINKSNIQEFIKYYKYIYNSCINRFDIVLTRINVILKEENNNLNKNYDSYLLKYINSKNNKNIELEPYLYNLIEFIKDKDIFLIKYQKNLTIRLNNSTDFKINNNDVKIIDLLNKLNIIDVSKLNKMKSDFLNSIKINIYLETIYNNYNTKLIYASDGIWPIKKKRK